MKPNGGKSSRTGSSKGSMAPGRRAAPRARLPLACALAVGAVASTAQSPATRVCPHHAAACAAAAALPPSAAPLCAWNATLGGVPHATLALLRLLFGAPDGFGSCAVVGSAGTLLGAGHGPEIDAHALVVRFNGAPTRGFERDVGARTAASVRNAQSLQRWCGARGGARCPAERVFVRALGPAASAGAQWARELGARCHRAGAEVLVVPPWLAKHAARTLGAPRRGGSGPAAAALATSGALGIVLAAALCPRGLSAYGFSTTRGARRGDAPDSLGVVDARRRFHYYENFSRPAPADNVPGAAARLVEHAAREQPGCLRVVGARDAAGGAPVKPPPPRAASADAEAGPPAACDASAVLRAARARARGGPGAAPAPTWDQLAFVRARHGAALAAGALVERSRWLDW